LRRKKRKRSFGEYYIEEFLKYNHIDYKKEKTFNSCRSAKNRLLRFDFYLVDYNILIEFQGMHHYKPVNKGYRAKRVHNLTVLHDSIKKEFCKDNNIDLIEIHYKDLKNIFDVLIEGLTEIIEN
jgi:hypothetical protein